MTVEITRMRVGIQSKKKVLHRCLPDKSELSFYCMHPANYIPDVWNSKLDAMTMRGYMAMTQYLPALPPSPPLHHRELCI